jgi:hypothetical protein
MAEAYPLPSPSHQLGLRRSKPKSRPPDRRSRKSIGRLDAALGLAGLSELSVGLDPRCDLVGRVSASRLTGAGPSRAGQLSRLVEVEQELAQLRGSRLRLGGPDSCRHRRKRLASSFSPSSSGRATGAHGTRSAAGRPSRRRSSGRGSPARTARPGTQSAGMTSTVNSEGARAGERRWRIVHGGSSFYESRSSCFACGRNRGEHRHARDGGPVGSGAVVGVATTTPLARRGTRITLSR